MTPDLALTLSHQGISLLCRVDGGWHLLADVALDREDLTEALAELRNTAITAAGEGFATTLVLPNDQLKFLTLPSTRAPSQDLRSEAEQALEANTPYAANELVFDLHMNGDTPQVAAVARDTLTEAESFAQEHALNPVNFTAIPERADFDKAPDFGLSAAAQAQALQILHDPQIITVIGEGLPPQSADSVPATADQPEESAPAEEEAAAFASIRAQRSPASQENTPQLSGVSRKVSGTNAPSIPTQLESDNTPPLRFDPAKAVAGLTKERGAAPNSATSEHAAQDGGTFASARGKTKLAPNAPHLKDSASRGKTSAKPTEKPSAEAKSPFFGAPPTKVGGKPKYLGLILTALLLLFLLGSALWVSVFTEDGVAGLLNRDRSATERADAPTSQNQPEAAAPATEEAAPTTNGAIVVSVPDGLTQDLSSDTTATSLLDEIAPEELAEAAEDALPLAEVTKPAVSVEDAETLYAATGIWQHGLTQLPAPRAEVIEDIYVPAIDRLTFAFDAVALPALSQLTTDEQLPVQSNPLAASVPVEIDARGLVVATPEGALNAEGVMIYAGRPPVVPASYPKRIIVAEVQEAQAEARLTSRRPKLRPDDLVEQSERANFGGLSRAELASKRPRLRPQSAQDSASANQSPTSSAVKISLRPRLKPANIAQLAARATQPEEKTTPPVAAAPAVAAVVPTIPTTASVARQATIQNAINLRKTSLIGVYGTSSNRRALVRLPSGRYKKVQVGDRIDGGKVAAIDKDELRYTKGGRNLVLKMPKDG